MEQTETFTHKERNENPLIKMGGSTLASKTHPENEDTGFMISDNKSSLKAFGVLDGMGGHAGGGIASGTARETILSRISNGNIDPNLSLTQTQDLVKSLLLEAHESVKEKATGNLTGMGTTASIGVIWEGENSERKLVVGNVGDSRIYLFREGKLTQLTTDDDLGHEGRGNVLTQAVGTETIIPRIGIFDIQKGDQLIAISDGISDAMEGNLDEEFKDALIASKGNPTEASNKLVKKAREYSNNGAKMDDQTALVVEIEGSTKENAEFSLKTQTDSNETELKKIDEYRLSPGTMVKVKRSDGKTEDDWFIVGKDDETGKIKLMKSNGNLTKNATTEQLDSTNPLTESANDWDELLYAVNQLPEVLQNSSNKQTREEITTLIEAIKNGGYNLINSVTRAHGLRETVKKMVKLDALRSQL